MACTLCAARNISGDPVTPDGLAQSALATTLGDLKQEISAGSFVINAGQTTVYSPKAPAVAVPALAGSTGTGGLENLVKRSANNVLFFAGVNYDTGGFPPSNRAANSPTTASSLNGIAVLPARWNRSLLLPKANGAGSVDLTPVSAFAAPDWIVVARDGTNPTFWNTTIRTDGANPAVGRYAYTIYDEGGLLDMTVAGHPAGTDARQAGYKDSLASADLTQVSLTQPQIDAVVHWRGANAFTGRQDLITLLTQGVATDDATRASLQNSLRFLGTFSRGLSQPSYFPVSRAASANNPNPRPTILPSSNTTDPTKGGGNNVGDNYTTGVAQDALSPSFLTLRAGAAFARNDGTVAVAGEPLAKKRFALQRLAWLTYLGPSAQRTIPTSNPGVDSRDYDLWQLVNNYGVSRDFLAQGTAVNIQKYFGLEWDAANLRWKYNVHNRGGTTGAIRPLGEVAALKTREPDFFELLKASVDPGALGKASILSSTADLTESSPVLAPLNFQFLRDISLDAAVMQLAANILDQFDTDGYPARIVFDDGSGRPAREFRGVENLPYIYRIRDGILRVREPIPEGNPGSRIVGAGNPNNNDINGCTPERHSGAVTAAAAATYPLNPLKDTGVGVLLAIPDIWNPHDQNSSLGSPRPGLTAGSMRVIASSATPDGVATNSGYSQLTVGGNGLGNTTMGRYKGISYQAVASGGGGSEPVGAVPPSAPPGSDAPVPPFSRTPTPDGTGGTPMSTGYNNGQIITSIPVNGVTIPTSSTLSFSIPSSTGTALFREPTLLAKPDTTSGSGLAMTITNPDITQLISPSGPVWTGAGLRGTTGTYNSATVGTTNPLSEPNTPSASQSYIGLYLGAFPLRWVGSRWINGPYLSPSTTYWVYTSRTPGALGASAKSITYSLQFQDAFGNWVSYDEKYVGTEVNDDWVPGGLLLDGLVNTFTFADPRTSRFGAPDEQYAAYNAPRYHAPTSATWIDTTTDVFTTERPDIHAGFGGNFRGTYFGSSTTAQYDWGAWAAAGWHYKNIYVNPGGVTSIFFESGLLAQNDPNFGSDGIRYTGDTGVGATDAQFYTDPDGVVRRGMAAFVTTNTGALGQPLATASTYSGGKASPTPQSASRPKLLNRPFRSVGELGYVFSGTPWKNLDFSTPESGYSELLDVFCVGETDDAGGLVAGRLNLNTRQQKVLTAVLAGTLTSETTAANPTLLPAGDADAVAGLLVTRTASGPASNGGSPQPLANVADLVGRWVGKQAISGTFTPALYASHNLDGSKSYDGFGADLAALPGTNTLATPVASVRESTARALANVGNTRVWNLLIDVIAQTGEYPASATGFDQFTVAQTQRYWLHVAIDRLTGEVIDQSLEPVAEVTPSALTLSGLTVAENQPAGTTVGTLGAVDAASARVFRYALVSGAGGEDNASFAVSGDTLRTAAVLHSLEKSSYHVRLQVADQDGVSLEKTFIVTVPPGAYSQWKLANFGNSANDPAVAGDLVDGDGDGLVNLLEYALGTSPSSADVSGISTQRTDSAVQFDYTRRSTATDVTARVYWNSDLTQPGGWTTSGITEVMLSDDGTLQRWRATLPINASPRIFLRLQVNGP